MVLSDSTPSPGLYEFAAVAAPIRFAFREPGRGPVAVTVENRRHSADTSDLVFRWRIEHDGQVVSHGVLGDLEPIGAGAAATAAVPDWTPAGTGETWLTVEAALAADTAWAAAGHVIASGQRDLTPAGSPDTGGTPPAPLSASAATSTAAGTLQLGVATFDEGRLVRLAGLPVTGPRLELWRAPTDNDRGNHLGSYDDSDPLDGEGLGVPGPSYAAQWLDAGLHRLVARVEDVSAIPSGLRIRTRYGAPDHRAAVTVEETWIERADELWLRVEIEPTSRWTVVWPRVGVRFDLPAAVDHAAWFGTGPGDSYPDSRRSALVGRYAGHIDDLSVRYARPQESGHRSDLRSLHLSAGGEPYLSIDAFPDARGRRPGFTLTRHTAQELGVARHPHELPPPSASYLYLDADQNGLGSRACGPDVWPDALLRPENRTLILKMGSNRFR
jgi:beta-galactosidase